jgi:hypothetical protein
MKKEFAEHRKSEQQETPTKRKREESNTSRISCPETQKGRKVSFHDPELEHTQLTVLIIN